MNIIVCIKQVPDAKDVRLDPKTNTLAREGVESIMNPFDRHALEEASIEGKARRNGYGYHHGTTAGGRGAAGCSFMRCG